MYDRLALVRLAAILAVCALIVLVVWILRAKPPRTQAAVLSGVVAAIAALPPLLYAL